MSQVCPELSTTSMHCICEQRKLWQLNAQIRLSFHCWRMRYVPLVCNCSNRTTPLILSLSLSLSLSLYLFPKFANSLDPENLQRLAKPNQGQTGIPRINNVSERPTLRPMPRKNIIQPWHEISNNVVCATNEGSDKPAPKRSLIRAFAGRLNILSLLSYWPNIIWGF